jgi:hypothetical protein
MPSSESSYSAAFAAVTAAPARQRQADAASFSYSLNQSLTKRA